MLKKAWINFVDLVLIVFIISLFPVFPEIANSAKNPHVKLIDRRAKMILKDPDLQTLKRWLIVTNKEQFEKIENDLVGAVDIVDLSSGMFVEIFNQDAYINDAETMKKLQEKSKNENV